MHKNKDQKYVACSKLHATYFRARLKHEHHTTV
ncbi:hypothetical protein ACVIRO_003562 [Rhizobium ruizarguesonis]